MIALVSVFEFRADSVYGALGRGWLGKGLRDALKRSATCQGLGSNRRAWAGIRLNSSGTNLEASDWPLEVEGHLPGRGGGPTALTTTRPSGRLFFAPSTLLDESL